MNDSVGSVIGPLGSANGSSTGGSSIAEACQLSPAPIISRGAQGDPAQRRLWREGRARAEAQVATEQRISEQLGMVSHELRNSLGALRIGIRMMETKRGEPASVAQARALVESQFVQMSRLIDDLMQVSLTRSGALRLRRERIDLGAVVSNAVAILRPEIVRRRQRLVVKRPETVLWLDADPGRLQQVLMNLLNNAAKFTDEGGEVRLTVARDDGWVTVRVADTGIGISPHDLPYVFDAFRQMNSQSLGSGIGIGLAVVRELVELHGGRVSATSAGLGKGSEFTLRMPALRAFDCASDHGATI